MNEQTVIDLGTEAAWMSIKVSAPVLVTALIVGLVISVFQAATQINEQTITFVPKILCISVVLAVTGPWILQIMLVFTAGLFNRIPTIANGM